ncbi:MAG: DUF2268 domain-containing putative Zn-dependent protease [Tannerellaceae bacterium]|nr:DUF2268 domain-containing putative Zn-dependent protease [Tannerellaceae bacterium]
MITRLFLTGLLSVCFTACQGQQAGSAVYADATPVHINRFDKKLFELIQHDSPEKQEQVLTEYPEMLDVLGKGILNIRSVNTPGFFDKLVNFYSEPTLKGLYQDALTMYDRIDDIELQLGYGFTWLQEELPEIGIPAFYMHVSGFNQNVLVGDSLLSISIDKYLGYDYPLYQDFFYPFQRIQMQQAQIVPDYIRGWLLAEFPFEGKENVLLERMIYEGSITYMVAQAVPTLPAAELLGYTEQEYNWCQENEGEIWKALIERKHLYTPDHITTSRYFEPTPSFFLAEEAPGNLGNFIGYQIVKQYMKQTKNTPAELIKAKDYQQVLTASKYKP